MGIDSKNIWSLKWEIATWFLLISFVTIAIVGLLGFTSAKAALETQMKNHLKTAVNAKAFEIELFLEIHEGEVGLLSSEDILKELLKTDKNNEDYNQKLESVNTRLKQVVDSNKEAHFAATLVDKSGTVVATTTDNKESLLGGDKSDQEFYLKGRNGTYISNVYILSNIDKVVFDIATPVFYHSEFLGVVNVTHLVDALAKITSENIGLGASEEYYLINSDKKMITSSQFIKDIILKQEVNTMNARQCFEKRDHPEAYLEHTQTGVFRDYKGVFVLGSHAYLPRTDWCLLVDIDENKLLVPIYDLRDKVLIIGVIIIGFSILLGLAFSIKITRPLGKLTSGAEIIGKGRLDHRIYIKSKDEIGQLAHSLNEMAEELQESYRNLEMKVLKRTQTLARAKARDDAMLENIGDGLVFTNLEKKVVLMNRAAEKMLGWQALEIKGKNWDETIQAKDESGKKISLNNLPCSKVLTSETTMTISTTTTDPYYYTRKDGSIFPVAVTASKVSDKGEDLGLILVFRDITKDKEVDRAKTEFVSLASHQLRTPLAGMNWYAEMLLSGDAGRLNPKQKDYFKEIYKSSRRLSELVSALLNVSRLELGTFIVSPQSTNVVQMVNDILKEMKPSIENKKLIIKKDFAKDISSIQEDPKMLHMIIQNLIANAVKYTPKNGQVTVKLSIKDKQLVISVKDNGIGIPEGQQDKIFTKLFRADNANVKDTEGTGLGLYIVKLILDHVGGKIWFESKQDAGSTFYVSLPLR